MQADVPSARAGLVWTALRRRGLVVLAIGCAGLMAGFAVAMDRAPTYRATATVLVNPVTGNPYGPEPDRDTLTSLESEAIVVGSRQVARLARERLTRPIATSTLQRNVGVVVPPNTQMLQISYTAADPVFAREATQAFSTAYLDTRRQWAHEEMARQVAAIQRHREQVLDELRAAGSGEQIEGALENELAELGAEQVILQNTRPVAGAVITPATTPPPQGGLVRVAPLLAGLSVGMLAGFALAVTTERARGLVEGEADVERAGVPVLATFTDRARRVGRGDPGPEPAIRLVEAMVEAGPQPSVVAVGSCSPRAEEPGVAVLLALALCASGADVTLVDAADRGRDDLEPVDKHAPGMSDVLLQAEPAPGSVLVSVAPGLRLLPPGQRMAEAADSFVPDRLNEVLRRLADESDFVVVRSPSVLSPAGAALSATAGSSVLVVVPESTTRTDLSAAVRAYRRSGRLLLGAVLAPRTLSDLDGKLTTPEYVA